MKVEAGVSVEFASDWLASAGGTGGGDVDDLVQRGSDGLPLAPMSSIKGILRESAQRLEDADAPDWPRGSVSALFGDRRPPGSLAPSREGCLVFSGDARLSEADRRGFAGHAAETGMLFVRRASTAIDETNGTAKARSLRAVDAAVPMTLFGRIRVREGASPPEKWPERLDEAAAWSLALGKGKADGFGRAIIRVDPVTAATSGKAPDTHRADAAPRLIVLLEQTERAVFSAASATEGAHQTRIMVPGSALLGWAARNYSEFDDPYSVFHSGDVRFGDGRPVTARGELLWPTPQVILEPKHSRGGVNGIQLDATRAFVRRAPALANTEPLDRIKPKLVSGSGQVADANLNLALRTAMEEGRPAAGQLFGYTSLAATPDRTRRFVAVIERDTVVGADDWKRLRQAFDGRELLLGRAVAAGQGGVFKTCLLGDQDILPVSPAPHDGRMVVWALSDLAILDEHGEPSLAPTPMQLGLGKGVLLASESAIAARRYAPWRGHLGSRDVEHAVIEAGSVLVFDVTTPAGGWTSPVGLYRELGLGRIWINPPLLDNLRTLEGEAVRQPETAPTTVEMPPEPITPRAGDQSVLFQWARRRLAARTSQSGVIEHFESRWRSPLRAFYAAHPKGEGPSRSQWRRAAGAEGADVPSLRRTLFADLSPVCGRRDQTTQRLDWLKLGRPTETEAPTTLREWLEAALAGPIDLATARRLLRLAADNAERLAGKEERGRG